MYKLYNCTMTNIEFESIMAKANLSVDDGELFAIVNEALLNVETLKQYDGDDNE